MSPCTSAIIQLTSAKVAKANPLNANGGFFSGINFTFLIFPYDLNKAFISVAATRRVLFHLFGIDAQDEKDRYQCYSWATRPIDPLALHYAQQDCHYLIRIHEKMKEELDNDAYYDVLQESDALALQ
ncbi:unnamed protein product, partial [Didymodactylos carnosus]